MDNQLLIDIEIESKYALKRLGYYPNILHPETFNEHILYNKFFNRDELLIKTTDKVEVNKYIIEKGFGSILIHNYYVTDNISSIPFDELPDNYIIKPNHLSGSLLVVRDGIIDRYKIENTCNKWMEETHYGKNRFIWCTSQIKPKIIIQEIIDENPIDYKFHMINGKCAFIGIYSAKKIGWHPRKHIPYDLNWNKLPFKLEYKIGSEVKKPDNLEEMLAIAEKLSEPFNYVRVDLYNINGRIYFGELTHFPNSGTGKFTPAIYDYKYGKLFNSNINKE